VDVGTCASARSSTSKTLIGFERKYLLPVRG
jgi:hypothetical protein